VLKGSFEGSLNVNRLKLLDADAVFRITKIVVQKAASSGNCVIVGRGSQHFLEDRSDTLRVFLYAPKEEKKRRLIAETVPEADAEELVNTVDRERAAFIEKYFDMKWPNPPLYHAMLNTTLGDQIVIDTILDLKKVMEKEADGLS
jgi:cytidylate kinase